MAAESRVLAIIPAYEAERTIGGVVEEALKHGPVLVVDDGSSDATSAEAELAGATVERQEPNQGKGAALKRGFQYALDEGYEALLTLDADGQHDPAEIPKLVDVWNSEQPEMVIGARTFSEMPFVRRMSNTIGRWSLSKAIGQDIPDNQSGYRIISPRLARTMLDSGETGFEFEVEMVLHCLRNNWPIAWAPIRTIYEDQGSHISPIQHVINFFRLVIRARRAARARPPAAA